MRPWTRLARVYDKARARVASAETAVLVGGTGAPAASLLVLVVSRGALGHDLRSAPPDDHPLGATTETGGRPG